MRKQYHFKNSDQGLLVWDVSRLISLTSKLIAKEIPLSSITELKEAYWYDLGNAKPTCLNIIEHAQLINSADLQYPIILCHQGSVMDGMHRVCKATIDGHNSILAIQFNEYVEPDYINIDLKDLQYD